MLIKPFKGIMTLKEREEAMKKIIEEECLPIAEAKSHDYGGDDFEPADEYYGDEFED